MSAAHRIALAGAFAFGMVGGTAQAQPASMPAMSQAVTPTLDAQRTERLEVARSIISIMFPPERRDQMMGDLLNSMSAQMTASLDMEKYKDPGLRKIIEDHLASIPARLRPAVQAFLPRQSEAMAQAYASMFTLDQLRDVAAFARTPSGSDYLVRSTEVLSDPVIAETNTEYFRQVQRVSAKANAELTSELQAYLLANPDAVRK